MGNLVYIGKGSSLKILDVSNPVTPIPLGETVTPAVIEGIYISGNYAYVADGGDGLRIIDVSNPSAPVEVGFYDTGGLARNVYVVGNYGYVADTWADLRIIDVSNPFAPMEVGFYDPRGSAGDVYVVGSYVYVADWVNGLYILRNDLITGIAEEGQTLPRAFVLKQNYPNPFNPVTTIEFSLPHVSRITLYVYDVAGRKVKTLVNGNLPAGNHTIKWDGTDSAGQPVASGVYLYRLAVGQASPTAPGQASLSFVQTRKMVLLK